jgi:hypothetical protein
VSWPEPFRQSMDLIESWPVTPPLMLNAVQSAGAPPPWPPPELDELLGDAADEAPPLPQPAAARPTKATKDKNTRDIRIGLLCEL